MSNAPTVDDVIYRAPQVSAGEGGTEAPAVMTQTQLIFQAKQLIGRDVVYRVACPDGTYENRAGHLVELPNGLFVRNSERFGHIRGVRPWNGPAQQFAFPGDFVVQRIVAAHVHQAEVMVENEREVTRLLALVATQEQRIHVLERQLHESDRIVETVQANAEATARSASAERTATAGSHAAGSHAPSYHASFPNSPTATPATPGNLGIGGSGARKWGHSIPVDLNFMHATFESKDRNSCEAWMATLHSEEIRTVADLAKLSDNDWDKIQLPLIVKRKLQEVSRGSI